MNQMNEPSLFAQVLTSLKLRDRAGGDDVPAPMQVAEGERIVWHGSASSPWPMAVGAALVLMGVVIGFVAPWWNTVICIVAGLAVMAFLRIRVVVDRRGLAVHFGSLPFPKVSFPVEDIDHASTIDLLPMEWGGWGYRGSVKAMKRAAVVIRKGEAIRLQLKGGREFAVTVNGAAQGASALNALIAQAAPGQESGR